MALEARIAVLQRQAAEALARIKESQRQVALARKDSSASSKPPSSDIAKPPRLKQKGGGSKRKRRGKPKRGGQPGHP